MPLGVFINVGSCKRYYVCTYKTLSQYIHGTQLSNCCSLQPLVWVLRIHSVYRLRVSDSASIWFPTLVCHAVLHLVEPHSLCTQPWCQVTTGHALVAGLLLQGVWCFLLCCVYNTGCCILFSTAWHAEGQPSFVTWLDTSVYTAGAAQHTPCCILHCHPCFLGLQSMLSTKSYGISCVAKA